MKSIFNNYPITIQTKCMNEEILFEQIDELKKLNDAGLVSSHFFNLLRNAHNRSIQHRKNTFTISEWIDHYESDKIMTDSEQLILFFEYIQKYHPALISKSEKKYTLINSPKMENFGLELIVLQTLKK